MDTVHLLYLIQAVCLVFTYLLFIIVLLLGFLNKKGKNCINQKTTACSFIKKRDSKKSWEASRLFRQLPEGPTHW